ncbi:MAG: S8 family peptidase [Candidatus Nanopelagicales bacterium]|nr:S8 family peptidase [Candidatus Nanopelagicales bacterium]MDZ4249417.1 S8 family peptidase [Candidatus Nanopelagicales bacterium]
MSAWLSGGCSVLSGLLFAGLLTAAPASALDVAEQHMGATDPLARWTQPDESATAKPGEVIEGVRRGEEVRVVSVREVNGRPKFVERDAKGRRAAKDLVERAQAKDDVVAVAVDTKVRVSASSDDTKRSEQWALDMLGAEDAWSAATGNGVVVAVIDTGVDGSHPDLSGALVSGYNARTDQGDSTSPATDQHGHGTHVAGTIAARAGNGIGIAGLAPDASVMPVKVLGADGSGYTSDVAEGIVWAVDHGAAVLNMSLGGGSSSVMEAAVEYAVDEGATLVAAAGNDGSSSPFYPAAYPGVLSVAAINSSGERASWSNYGSTLDLAAPGVSVLSTLPGSTYASWSGTSMASPHVAASAALILELAPTSDVGYLLTSTALDLGSTGWDIYYGHGGVRPRVALDAVGGAPPEEVEEPEPVKKVWKAKQSIKARKSIKRTKTRKLRRLSNQGVPVAKWTTKSPRVCEVFHPGKRWLVLGKRQGRCVLRVVVPKTDDYRRLKARKVIWVK